MDLPTSPFVVTGVVGAPPARDWSVDDDKPLRDFLEPLGPKISWKTIESTLVAMFPGMTLNRIQNRWKRIKNKKYSIRRNMRCGSTASQ